MKALKEQAKQAIEILQAILDDSPRVRCSGSPKYHPEWASDSLTLFLDRWTLTPLEFGEPPEGHKWHNPEGFTPEHVEVDKGWRLLCTSEKASMPHEYYDSYRKWVTATTVDMYAGRYNSTYRTKAPLPAPVPKVKEMTVAEIEKALGYRVKVVRGENESKT